MHFRFFHGGEARPGISLGPQLSWEYNWVFKESLQELKAKLRMRVYMPESRGMFQYASLRKSMLPIYNECCLEYLLIDDLL